MVDTNTLVLIGCFAAAACVLFWLDRRNDEGIEPERRSDKMTTSQDNTQTMRALDLLGKEVGLFKQDQ